MVAACLLAALAPRMAPDPGLEEHRGPRLRVLSANIYEGRAELVHLRELVRELRPDVLSVQELTPLAAEELARLGFHRTFPHRVLEVDDFAVGAGLYSRFPMREIPARRRPAGSC